MNEKYHVACQKSGLGLLDRWYLWATLAIRWRAASDARLWYVRQTLGRTRASRDAPKMVSRPSSRNQSQLNGGDTTPGLYWRGGVVSKVAAAWLAGSKITHWYVTV